MTTSAFGSPLRRSATNRLASSRQLLWIAGVAWGVPVVVAVARPGDPVAASLTLVVGISFGLVVLFQPRSALIALPFFALLSPLGGFLPLPGARLLLSDVIFPLLATQSAILLVHRRMRFRTGVSFAALLGTVYLVSMVAGFAMGTLVSLKPVLYLLQFAIVLLYTREYARTEEDWSVLISAWIAAIVLGALLLIRAFLAGTPLANFEYGADAPAVSQNIFLLFRATYYYAGFHFLLGAAIIVVLLRLLFPAPVRQRLLLVPVLLVLLAAILMMLAKTAIASILFTIVTVLVLMLPMRPKETAKAIVVVATWFSVVTVLISVVLFAVLGDLQAEMWVQRVFSGGSFIARVEVYAQALASWLSRPLAVITGMGPDFLGDSGSPELAHSFMRSARTGVQEGAVDSGWITYMLELGIIGVAALASAYYASLQSVRRALLRVRGNSIFGPSLSVLAALIFLAVALMTQMLGYSKTAWFPFQLLVIGLMHGSASTGAPAPSDSTQT